MLKSDLNYYKDSLNLSFSILKTIEILKKTEYNYILIRSKNSLTLPLFVKNIVTPIILIIFDNFFHSLNLLFFFIFTM